LSDDIYCIYTDYESDHSGWYTAVLGCRVKQEDGLPEGLVVAKVPEGNYRVYTPVGEFPANIASTWRYIWQDNIDRSYLADFDLYKAGSKSFGETEAEVYLGVV
jgi:predicted transcriptional regulator YdeE